MDFSGAEERAEDHDGDSGVRERPGGDRLQQIPLAEERIQLAVAGSADRVVLRWGYEASLWTKLFANA